MNRLKKLLSVLLALVLCGIMAAPAFAATFNDLNNAINEHFEWGYSSGQKIGDTNRYGYAGNSNGGYGIIAWDEDGTRHVQLNEDVVRADPVYSDADPEASPVCDASLIYVSDNVTLDMQGNTIDGKEDGAIFYVTGEETNLTVNAGKNGKTGKVGTLTGGNAVEGGAVYVTDGASFEMNGGKITGNKAEKGGGIYAGVGTEVTLNGAKVSNNGADDVYLDYAGAAGAKLNAPGDVTWTDTANEENTYTGNVDSANEAGPLSLKWTGHDEDDDGNGGGNATETTGPSAELTGVEITDPDVPLAAGPVSCAEFIDKMWRLDGEPAPVDDRGLPESVDKEHEYASAIVWAMSANIVSPETFDPEELLTVALVKEFLGNFAAYADMAMPKLTTLTGSDSDLVMNTDEVLDEFFGERYSV